MRWKEYPVAINLVGGDFLAQRRKDAEDAGGNMGDERETARVTEQFYFSNTNCAY
jgi:hypothetical protein